MLTRRVAAFSVAALALLAAAPLAAATLLRQVALTAPEPASARIELELSATPSPPRVSELKKPDRVVIDLSRTSLARGVKLPKAAGPVKALRTGTQAGGVLRVVLELKQPMPYRTRVEGSKLVIELGAPAAVAAAATPATPAPPAPPKPVRPAHAPDDSGRDIVVAIDPGHGGQDPGAIGRGGTYEKTVVLAIAQALAKKVNAEPGMRAFLTRSNDRFIPLRERTALARRAGADIFISVHADSSEKSTVSGSTVYVLSARGASSEAARLLADRENAADLRGGHVVADDARASVLLDLAQTASIGHSGEAAERVLVHLDRVGTVRRTKVESAGFVVLKSHDIPSMLVETAFISNPAEEKRLRSPAHQDAVAEAIFNGVRDYFRQSPPDGTLFARQRDERRLVAAQPAP